MVTLIGGIIGVIAITLCVVLILVWMWQLYTEVCETFERKDQIIDVEYYEIEED